MSLENSSILIWVLIMCCGLKRSRSKSIFLFGVCILNQILLAATSILCSNDCGCLEDIDHFFLQCDFFGRLWSLISGWLGFGTIHHGNI